MRRPSVTPVLFAALALGCGSASDEQVLPLGLLLSYSGNVAANSINSERALLMAIEAANQVGGVAGRPLKVLARDTGSDPAKVSAPALELEAANVAVIIGPDLPDLAVALRADFAGRTMIMPSFTTASSSHKPHPWFVMGAGTGQVACELHAQLQAAMPQKPLVISGPNGYDSALAWVLTSRYGIPQIFLPGEEPSNTRTVQPIIEFGADAYVLTAPAPAASSLFYTLAALDRLGPPTRWFLSPSLHTPALLENIPRGLLEGTIGVSAVKTDAVGTFGQAFEDRWKDRPLDDAYPFFDAGAIALLALERAVAKSGVIPEGAGLSEHIVAVTRPGGTQLGWDGLQTGLGLVRAGQEVEYIGLTGPLNFDASGRTAAAHTSWWTISGHSFQTIPNPSGCPQ